MSQHAMRNTYDMEWTGEIQQVAMVKSLPLHDIASAIVVESLVPRPNGNTDGASCRGLGITDPNSPEKERTSPPLSVNIPAFGGGPC